MSNTPMHPEIIALRTDVETLKAKVEEQRKIIQALLDEMNILIADIKN